MIKFLSEDKVSILENDSALSENLNVQVIIPNGNFDVSSSSFISH